jgi:ATP-dependent protease ClpP protease subunit
MSKEYKGIRFINESSTDTVELIIEGEIGYESWWDKERDENTLYKIRQELNRIKELKAKNIIVKIHSLGGSVDHALAIHDVLKDHSANVDTQVNGMCASAATIIAMAGTKRKMSKNSLYLIHKCSSWCWGNENEMEAEIESQRTVNKRILSIYKEYCPEEKHAELETLFNVNNGSGKWIDANESKNFGFATEIYNETAKAAAIDKTVFAKLKYPPLPAGYDFDTEDKEPGRIYKLLQKIDDFFNMNDNPNTNKKQQEMKKLSAVFPLMFALIAFKTDDDYDPAKGRAFSDEELKALETKIAEFNTAKEKFDADKTALETKLTDMTTQRDALQTKVDATPAPNTKQASGADSTPNAWDDYMKNDPFYKSINQ